MSSYKTATVATFLTLSSVSLSSPKSQNTATVDLSTSRDPSADYAAGILYGLPDTPNQIPDRFYTDIGFSYHRTGGAQLDEYGGWVTGLQGYEGRINSTKSNYDTARKYGADVIVLCHDLWGTDHTNNSTVWPGDGGDFSDYDDFLDRIMDDFVSLDMRDGLVIDLWNEPDIDIFWERSQQQWIDLYVHSHKRIRANPAMDSVRISGPSLAYRPFSNNTWWTNWLEAIAGNDTAPDQYSYHLEGEPTDPDSDLQNTHPSLIALLEEYGLPPAKDVNVNEYATFDEQHAAGAAWWISRFERYDTHALRGNWLSGCQLHDFLASLLSKPGAPNDSICDGKRYYGNGEYQVYNYSHTSMTGPRANTTGSEDRIFDVHATLPADKDNTVRLLAGTRYSNGTYYVCVEGLESVGLPANGELEVQTRAFIDRGHWGRVDGPEDRGTRNVEYEDGKMVLEVVVLGEDIKTAFAFEFNAGKGANGYGKVV